MTATDKLLFLDDVKDRLGKISRYTAAKLCDPKRTADPIPTFRLTGDGRGSPRRVLESDLLAWIERRRLQSIDDEPETPPTHVSLEWRSQRRKITREQEAAILRLDSEGKSVKEIAKTVGVSRPTVYAITRR